MKQGKSTKGNQNKGNGDMQLVAVLLLCSMLFGVSRIRPHNREIIGYTYTKGSSVYELASRCCPDDMDIRDVARQIEKLNGIENHIVYSDVLYQIPVYED